MRLARIAALAAVLLGCLTAPRLATAHIVTQAEAQTLTLEQLTATPRPHVQRVQYYGPPRGYYHRRYWHRHYWRHRYWRHRHYYR